MIFLDLRLYWRPWIQLPPKLTTIYISVVVQAFISPTTETYVCAHCMCAGGGPDNHAEGTLYSVAPSCVPVVVHMSSREVTPLSADSRFP